jgi:phosphinothricin acetyltransferase
MAAAIRAAQPADWPAVAELLAASGLPTAGLREHFASALVAVESGGVVGSAALELYPEGALLRSVAVSAAARGSGIGRELTQAAIRLAERRHAPAIYLLTTTAERYFPKFGFETISRGAVPLSIQSSVEFTSACPASAAVMRRRLRIVRAATLDDLPALIDIYNHYVLHTAITFDLRPITPDERRAWFEDHRGGRHRVLVAAGPDGSCLGYATTSRWRPKAAYETTVEASVYCRPDVVASGCGSLLYTALFEAIAAEDIHRIVAGISLPNAASVRLHERFGFSQVGVFHAVGRKFDRYWDVAWFERPLTLENAAGAIVRAGTARPSRPPA